MGAGSSTQGKGTLERRQSRRRSKTFERSFTQKHVTPLSKQELIEQFVAVQNEQQLKDKTLDEVDVSQLILASGERSSASLLVAPRRSPWCQSSIAHDCLLHSVSHDSAHLLSVCRLPFFPNSQPTKQPAKADHH